MPSSLVLVPTFNENQNLSVVLPRLSALEDTPGVLVIDDSSPDGTGDLAERLRSRYPRLSVLHRREKEGLGKAYIHGFTEALRRGYEAVVTMDADLSHAPEDVPRLLAALAHADVALGSRHVPGGEVLGWPLHRRLLSRSGSLYSRTLLRLPLRDVTSGFRAYRASALGELDLDSLGARGFIFQVEVLRRILDLPGARAVEVPITFRERVRGRSKLTRAIILEGILEVARLSVRRRAKIWTQGNRPSTPRRLHCVTCLEPKVSVIVPARPGSGRPEALSALEGLSYPAGKLEILVARGTAPARQRNVAVRHSSGEVLLFLDDDSLASPGIVREYLAVLARDPSVAAVGGPAVPAGESRLERIFGLVLSEPLIVGRTASRYARRGAECFTGERELILCNLAVRRRAFLEAGGFDESLYPNEENELLERLRLRGSRLVHCPEAMVRRSERRTLREFLRGMWRYGRGRGLQLKVLRSRTSIARALLAVVAAVGALSTAGGLVGAGPWCLLPPMLYMAHMGAAAARLSFRGGFRAGFAGVGLGVLLHASYAAGILQALFARRIRGGPAGEGCHVAIERPEFNRPPPRRGQTEGVHQ